MLGRHGHLPIGRVIRRQAGSAAELAATRKEDKCVDLGEARETSYLFQRISVLVQRFNAVLLHDSLPAADCTD